MEHDCPDGSTAIIALVLGTDLFITNLGRAGHFAWTRFSMKPGSSNWLTLGHRKAIAQLDNSNQTLKVQ